MFSTPRITFLMLTLWICWIHGVLGTYPMSSALTQQLPYRLGSATFVLNHTLYTYGGEERGINATQDFVSVAFASDGSIIYNPVRVNQAGPSVAYSQAVLLPDNDTVLLFGGSSWPPAANGSEILVYQFRFSTRAWTPAPINGTAVPSSRMFFTATLASNGLVYIYGGAGPLPQTQAAYNDFWSYNPATGQFVNLTAPGQPTLYGHNAIALPNGQILYVFGSTADEQNGGYVYMPGNQGLLYDTTTNAWNVMSLNDGDKVSSRQDGNAVLGPDQKTIFFFAGDDGGPPWSRRFRNRVDILDTSTWQWTMPTILGSPPRLRSFASAGLISDQYIIFAYGGAGNLYYNDINVLQVPPSNDLSTVNWVANVTTGALSNEPEQVPAAINRGVIAAIVIVCVIAAILILFLLWRFRRGLRRRIMRLHYDFWKPRSGEPLWAETARLVCKLILAILFFLFFAFVIVQVVNSPKATYSVTEPAADGLLAVPDVRFCFNGYTGFAEAGAASPPTIGCQTDGGVQCNSYIHQLDLSTHAPYFIANLGQITCFLFMPDSDFKLGENGDPATNNGTKVQFNMFASTNQTGLVHIAVYPPGKDPNRVYYFNATDQYLDSVQMQDWLNNDGNDFQTTNILDLDPFTFSVLSYQLQYHQYLQDTGWNYVGFAPSLNSTPEIITTTRQQAPGGNIVFLDNLVNVMFLNPSSFTIIRLREQKIYSLLNAVGFVGGLYGLFVAFQTIMFGYRPRSPWGIVHRWSVGDMRRSISKGLKSRFDLLHTPVPLVNPVHRRFSRLNIKSYGIPNDYCDDDSASDIDEPERGPANMDDARRLERVEDRIQLLELLFKSYYIDDEVFRRLDRALKKPERYEEQRKRRSLADMVRGRRYHDNKTHTSVSSDSTPRTWSMRPLFKPSESEATQRTLPQTPTGEHVSGIRHPADPKNGNDNGLLGDDDLV